MLQKFASHFIKIGQEMGEALMVFNMAESLDHGDPMRELDESEKEHLIGCLQKISDLCPDLELPISEELFKDALQKPPKTQRELELLLSALNKEMKTKLVFYLPSHRQKFMQPRKFMTEDSKEAFPKARQEMAAAGRCHAVGQHTAAVFHCMRAVEIGMRAMAIELNVTVGDLPLELADQENVIRGIESKIQAMKDRRKGTEKDEDLNFYSQAAMQFRYFKDGWRVRTAHTRATYEEPEALAVLEHTAAFIGDLSKRLKEPVL